MRAWDVICREPYRLFFPLGILLGIVGSGHWLVYGLGLTPAYSGHYHAFVQTSLYMACFVTGFLTTAIPKFSATHHASGSEVLMFLGFILAAFIFITLGRFIEAESFAIALLLVLGIFIGRRFLKRSAQSPPAEFVWIPVAFLHGIAGHFFVVLSLSGVLSKAYLSIGRPMAEQGFLLSLVAGIGGFLGPRLMGVHELRFPQGKISVEALRGNRIKVHLTAGFLLWATFWFPSGSQSLWVCALRALIITAEFTWNQSLFINPPSAKGLLPKIIWTSFWMIFLGLWGSAIFPKYRLAMLHFIFLGGFSLMTFGVATMVTFSHSGQGLKLQSPLWALRIVLWGVVLALIFRVIAVFFPESYFSWLAIAATLWIVTGASWLLLVARLFFKVPNLTEFDSHHQQIKERTAHSC